MFLLLVRLFLIYPGIRTPEPDQPSTRTLVSVTDPNFGAYHTTNMNQPCRTTREFIGDC
jgi:hypothetical protein